MVVRPKIGMKKKKSKKLKLIKNNDFNHLINILIIIIIKTQLRYGIQTKSVLGH
jgi:hypothetical protein